MDRRSFFKKLSVASITVGSITFLLSYTDFFNQKGRSADREHYKLLDRVAFIETIYPFFSMDSLIKHETLILNNLLAWNVIDNSFFNFFYQHEKRKFNTYSRKKREDYLYKSIQYFDKDNPVTSANLQDSIKKLLFFMTRQSFSPFAAYGYPDQTTNPFFADPSWEFYDKKPKIL